MNFVSKLIQVAVLVFITSCKSKLPAGFWLNFKPRSIVIRQSDQGPYGGKRSICWQAKPGEIFQFSEFKNFAQHNGWRFQDSIQLQSSWLTMYNYFPFCYTSFSDSGLVNVGFHSWVLSNATLYMFSTGWIAVKPGNAKDTDRNGYVVIGADGLRAAVYHVWGE